MIGWIEVAALVFGLVISALITLSPRFWTGSRSLLFLILPASFSAALEVFGVQSGTLLEADMHRLAFACIIFATAGGYLTGQHKKSFSIPILATGSLLIALLCLVPTPYSRGEEAPEGYVRLGLTGYLCAFYLLIVSVIVLARLEQVLRSASETTRWGLKFLFVGIAAIYAAIIYMSSQVLLFPPVAGLLPVGSLRLFHCIFPVSCGLIFISWLRSSGTTRISVSHGAIYSSITLFSVGVYLIASSLIARWAGQWGDLGLPVEALVFLLSAIVLTVILLGTGFRHHARSWIRRNIFAGRYDYRHFWLEATEKVRSIDPPAVTASALADIVHRALGAIEVSVWVRRWNPTKLELLSSTGAISGSLEMQADGVVEELIDITEPVSAHDLDKRKDSPVLSAFVKKTRASLLVPLLSSNRIVGVITVGADRSGRSYDWEAREFLRALAGHAAGEFHKSDLLETLVSAKEDEAFRAFSTFVLHDLKNFASTLSYIAQNAPKHQHNPEFQKDAFQSVYDTAEKMKRLCNSLRTFSSSLAWDKKPVDLNQIVQRAADTLAAAGSDHVKLELQSLPPVIADPEEIGRVVQNLLVNALEAIGEDGGIIIRTGSNGDHVEVSVEDNGKGMSREFMEKELFQPFHTTKSGGLGIGLFQSKKIMEAHKGTILVKSEEGKGTIITLRFKPESARRAQAAE